MTSFKVKWITAIALTTVFNQTKAQVSLPGSGNAISYQNDGAQVSFTDNWNDLDFPLTIMAWVKPKFEAGKTHYPIVATHNSETGYAGFYFQIVRRPNGRYVLEFAACNNGGFTGSNRRSYEYVFERFGLWTHVCAVAQNIGDYKLYINGNEVSGTYSGSANTLVKPNNALPRIGNHTIRTQEYPSL